MKLKSVAEALQCSPTPDSRPWGGRGGSRAPYPPVSPGGPAATEANDAPPATFPPLQTALTAAVAAALCGGGHCDHPPPSPSPPLDQRPMQPAVPSPATTPWAAPRALPLSSLPRPESRPTLICWTPCGVPMDPLLTTPGPHCGACAHACPPGRGKLWSSPITTVGGEGSHRDAPPLGHLAPGRGKLWSSPAVTFAGEEGSGFLSPSPSRSSLPCLTLG